TYRSPAGKGRGTGLVLGGAAGVRDRAAGTGRLRPAGCSRWGCRTGRLPQCLDLPHPASHRAYGRPVRRRRAVRSSAVLADRCLDAGGRTASAPAEHTGLTEPVTSAGRRTAGLATCATACGPGAHGLLLRHPDRTALARRAVTSGGGSGRAPSIAGVAGGGRGADHDGASSGERECHRAADEGGGPEQGGGGVRTAHRERYDRPPARRVRHLDGGRGGGSV